MKTSELTGIALDWAVAKCELMNGLDYTLAIDKDIDEKLRVNFGGMYPEWSSDWAQGGAIIEREKIEIVPDDACWAAYKQDQHIPSMGLTPLIAAMRCYVASKLGDEVEVPEELLSCAHE